MDFIWIPLEVPLSQAQAIVKEMQEQIDEILSARRQRKNECKKKRKEKAVKRKR